MKFLLTLTLTSVLAIGFAGCNKTAKVNASTTAAQCDGAGCDFANCDGSVCAKAANCPLAAAKAAQAKPAAVGATPACCANKSKAKARPAAAQDAKLIDCPLAGTTECPIAAAKTKPAAIGKKSSCCSGKK